MSIQTTIRNERGEVEELHPNDPRYWNGPYKYEPYPKLLFRATVGRYENDDLEQCIVKSEAEHRARGSAWKESPDDARAYLDSLEREVSTAAAEAKAASLPMSEQAQAELRHAEQATDEFVTDVTPAKRRGRPRKPKTADVSD